MLQIKAKYEGHHKKEFFYSIMMPKFLARSNLI